MELYSHLKSSGPDPPDRVIKWPNWTEIHNVNHVSGSESLLFFLRIDAEKCSLFILRSRKIDARISWLPYLVPIYQHNFVSGSGLIRN
jgi:hypothetical protein